MEVYVLNKELSTIAIIDSYKSLIWTTRYYEAGDFELYLPITDDLLSILQIGYYLIREDNDRIMIIEKLQIITDVEDGNFLIVTGRSAESILGRRIVWTQTHLYGSAERSIYELLDDNVLYPTITERTIPNFTLDLLHNYTEQFTMQVTGDKVSDAITKICKNFGWGWKITLTDTKKFMFSICIGTNKNITFSPEFDNLINSNYQYDETNLANVAVVAGEGEGTARTRAVVGSASGIERREIYVDSRDTSSNDGEFNEEAYNELLAQEGYNALIEYSAVQSFESEVEPNTTYSYKTDYDIGDIVNVENEYGITAKSRIIEIIESKDDTGYKVIPTFEDWSVEQ